MILCEEKLKEEIYSSFEGNSEVPEFIYSLLKEILEVFGRQYFRIGCQFIKEQLMSVDCLKMDENTLTAIREINERLLDENDCQKIIDYFIEKVEEEDDGNEEEFSEEEPNN